MPKYGVVTYKSRKQSNNHSAQTEFDLALAAKNNQNKARDYSKNGSGTTSKCEQKTKRTNEHLGIIDKKRKLNPLLEDELFGFNGSDTESTCNSVKEVKTAVKRKSPTKANSPLRSKSPSKAISPFKTDSLLKRSTCFNVNNSPFKSNLKSPVKTKAPSKVVKKTVKFNEIDKSTDDEAYESSHEKMSLLKEADSVDDDDKPVKKQSPFKHFLKNNVASLSPKKKKRLDRRFSALPTNTVGNDDTMSEDESEDVPSLTRASSWPTEASTSKVRVDRGEKQLFTVVRNVKHKYACLEDGETQQFFDDVEFALDGMRKDLSLAARCSSVLDLATQCSTPSFRANLRAHGFISKIFDCLQDAPTNKTLALCSSCVFYMITRDRLSVGFDHLILELLLKLLCIQKHTPENKIDVKKNLHEEMVKKTRVILTRLPESHTTSLDLENLSSTSLARESLLSLTSQRTGEWFKEEMRKLGGLDYIVDLILTSVVNIKDTSEELIQHEKGIENIKRCLKLIENVTLHNRENQLYLVSSRSCSLVVALSRLLRVCIHGIIEDNLASDCVFFKIILDCVKSILRVFLNLTHDNDGESETIGQQDGLIATLLLCVLQVPQFLSAEEQFDILVLALGLLINLMEHSKQNIAALIVLKTQLSYEESQNTEYSEEIDEVQKKGEVPAVEALVNLFQLRVEAAKNLEAMNNDSQNDCNDELVPTQDGLGWVCGSDIEEGDDLEKSTKDGQKKVEKSLEEELGEALQKAGKHMEDSMVASYVALLLGCLAKDNHANQNLIRELLPENNFDGLINTLMTFLRFMKLTSGTPGQAIEKIIDVLKKC